MKILLGYFTFLATLTIFLVFAYIFFFRASLFRQVSFVIVACLPPVGNRRMHGKAMLRAPTGNMVLFPCSKSKTTQMRLRIFSETRKSQTGKAAGGKGPPWKGGFRLRLADWLCRAEPKYNFIFGVIKGGGSLTLNSLTLNQTFIHGKGNFWKYFYCLKSQSVIYW